MRGKWVAAAIVGIGTLRAWQNRKRGPATVVYDGQCPMCRASIARLKRWDTGCRLAYVDGRDGAEVARRFPSLNGDATLREMRLGFPDGTMLGGFDAVRALTILLPRLRPLAPLMYLPCLRPFGVLTYRYVAAHRPIDCSDGVCSLSHPHR